MNLFKTQTIKTLKILVILVAVLLFSSNTFAQQKDKDNALLWKIEGNGLSKPSYLFGTVHMICEDKFIMPEKVKTAINQTEQSYLEINLDAADMAVESQKYMQSDKLLSEQLSAKDFQIVDSVVKSRLKVDLKKLDNIKPMIIVAGLMQASFTCKVSSFENEIIKLTKAKNKTIQGLSTIEEQYSFMDKIFDVKDLSTYLKTLNDKEMNSLFNSIYQAYIKEDVKTIDKILLDFSTTNPEGYRQLLPVRNNLWANRMPEIMKEKPTFFGVGCGHLLGTEGLVMLLRKQGYQVSPVYN